MPGTLAELAAAHPGKTLEVWFEDECRFGQKGTLTTVWADRGSRPVAPRPDEYGNLHVLAAVCPATGRAEGLISERLDVGVVQIFLDQLATTIAADTQVVMVWDGAPYHTSGKLRVPANITIVRLPPYSPELNPVENLWHFLRSHHWSNRNYVDLEAVEAAAMDAWAKVCLNPETIRSVCACPYLN